MAPTRSGRCCCRADIAVAARRRAMGGDGAAGAMKPSHRAAHRLIWLILAGLLPAVVLVSLALRHTGPDEAPQIQLAPPK